MKLSVIIPTYKRPADLPRLFGSLSKQIDKPEEVIVVIGPGDLESIRISKEWACRVANMVTYESAKPSVVHSINYGLSKATNEIICLLDDDVWLPPDWSVKIREAFEKNEKLGAFGGRDHLKNNNPEVENPPLAKEVGMFRWSGHKGNHHCGSQISPVKVDVIKGVNLSFRRTAFPGMQIEPALEGQGAETCWEMDICMRIRLAGYYNLYDNTNYVLHYWSPRLGFDNRTDVFSPAWPKRIFNETLIMARFRPLLELSICVLRLFLIGTHVQPGIVWSILLVKKSGVKVLTLPFRNTIFMWKGATLGLRRRQVVSSFKSNDNS